MDATGRAQPRESLLVTEAKIVVQGGVHRKTAELGGGVHHPPATVGALNNLQLLQHEGDCEVMTEQSSISNIDNAASKVEPRYDSAALYADSPSSLYNVSLVNNRRPASCILCIT